MKSGVAELATKADLDALRTATKADLAALRADLNTAATRLEGKLENLEERTAGRFRLLQWMPGFNLALSVATLWMLIRQATLP